MRDVLGTGTVLGYCTNVHAGECWTTTCANLRRHAPAVKAIVSPTEPMGVGLWLSARTARELIETDRIGALRDLLGEHELLAFTMNGFPYGDFHQPVVKHGVYEPDWTDPRRLVYTMDLATILDALLPSGAEGSISTLPIGWPAGGDETARFEAAAGELHGLAAHLHELEAESGRLIHVDLEPEPGCLLQDAAGTCAFFEQHLLVGVGAGRAGRHLRVCHDVCHAAVMHDDQAAAFERYRRAGIGVGKVQLSSAVRADAAVGKGGAAAADELAAFGEDRYLHQTTIFDGERMVFHEDLPEALAARDRHAGAEWRVHYHVPVFLEHFGRLGTTRGFIAEALPATGAPDTRHFEVETYAWNVLPEALRTDDLAAGIAREMAWVIELAGGTPG